MRAKAYPLRWLSVVAAVATYADELRAAVAGEAFDVRPFEREAIKLFEPGSLTAPLSETCDSVLLMAQALAAVLIIAGLLQRMRRSDAQPEGVAMVLLKIAFIATVPFWRGFVLDTSDVMAGAVGYHSGSSGQESSPVVARSWLLLAQWTPPGSPYLDALESQDFIPPASGAEEAWALRAWNWARGMGVATEEAYQGVWQATSGGVRALLVFGVCAISTWAVTAAIFVCYLADVARTVFFEAGCALAPVFIAGLSLELLRRPSARFLLALAGTAAWPIGWALVGLVTVRLLDGGTTWIAKVVSAAANVAENGAAPPLSMVAPYLGWGSLLLFASFTVVLSAWVAGSTLLVPILVTRIVSRGAASPSR